MFGPSSAPRVFAAAFVLSVLSTPSATALAQGGNESAEVDRDVALLRARPGDMSEDEWKERRRDAARRLGDLGDTRAVPVLIEVVKKEEFDIVGELAIEALGKLGDDRAVPVLQEVANDPDRDPDQQRAALEALRRLGAATTRDSLAPPPGRNDYDFESGNPSDLVAGSTPSVGPSPGAPEFDDDTLAAGEIVQFALGSLSFQYDSIRDRPTLNGDVSARYERHVDKKRVAWRYGATAGGAFGVVNFDGDSSSSRFVDFDVAGTGEGRAYLEAAPVYGGVLGAVATSITAARIYRPDDDNFYQMVTNGDVHAGITAGYGRVLDVGEALRLRRIEQVLRETRTLGRPLTPDVAEKIMGAWWALRGELGAHDRLVTTIRILRQAGVLLGEPSASVSYQILQVLTDGQLTHRLSGFDAGVGLLESYLWRDQFLPVDEGRAETVFARARYGHQSQAATREIIGSAAARYRVFAGDEAAPWAATARVDFHQFVYGRHYDPVGVVELGGEVGIANDDVDDSNTGTRIAGTAGWRWTFNRASTVRLSGEAALESGELFFGLTLDGSYGFLDAGYVGGSALPARISD